MGDTVLFTPTVSVGYGINTARPENYLVTEQSGFLLGGEVEGEYKPVSFFSSGGGILGHHLFGGSNYTLLAAKPFFTFHLPTEQRDGNLYGIKVGFPIGGRTRTDDSFRFTGGLGLEIFLNNPEVSDSETINYSEGAFGAGLLFLQTPLAGRMESSILMSLKLNFLGIFDSENYVLD